MANDFDIPIFQQTYDLYKTCYQHRVTIAKQDRHVLWQRIEKTILDIVEDISYSIQAFKAEKIPMLERASIRVNILRVLVRLAFDTQVIGEKKYIALETEIDEIGRQLGGWLRSIKSQQ